MTFQQNLDRVTTMGFFFFSCWEFLQWQLKEVVTVQFERKPPLVRCALSTSRTYVLDDRSASLYSSVVGPVAAVEREAAVWLPAAQSIVLPGCTGWFVRRGRNGHRPGLRAWGRHTGLMYGRGALHSTMEINRASRWSLNLRIRD